MSELAYRSGARDAGTWAAIRRALGTATVRTIGASSENAIAWRVGLLNFDDETLAEAAAVMNRYSQYQIVIHDPAVASMKVSGQFRSGDVQRFAATLADTHKLRAVRRQTRSSCSTGVNSRRIG